MTKKHKSSRNAEFQELNDLLGIDAFIDKYEMGLSIQNAQAITDFIKLKTPNILVIDDDSEFLSLIKSYINSSISFNGHTTQDEAEALRILKSEDIDLCMVDINLANLDGFQLGKFIREMTHFPIPIIYISAAQQEMANMDPFNSEFIRKPISRDSFNLEVRKMLDLLGQGGGAPNGLTQ